MKYIRTKDRIISSLKTVRTNDIVRKADTIEELCDEFYLVIYDALAKKKVRISFENCNSAKTHCDRYFKNFDWSIYGAIWTDKGLIYVAKMNDKGELELL